MMQTKLLIERLEKLNLNHIASQIESLLEDASKQDLPYANFLNTILTQEIENRESDELEKRLKKSKIPFQKTVQDFDFSFQPSLNQKRVNDVLTCRFIDSGENILLLGPPGVGKTHLSIAFTLEALIKGYSAYFMRAADFITECERVTDAGTVNRFINKMSKPDLLIIDELGYFPFTEMSANIFFHIISKRYENKGALIITSNKSFIDWGKIFCDDILATAVLDRLLHHSITFNIKGESYRMKEKRKAGIQPVKNR